MIAVVTQNQDSILNFPKCLQYVDSTYFRYLLFEISLLNFSVLFYFQNGHVNVSATNQLQGASLALVFERSYN